MTRLVSDYLANYLAQVAQGMAVTGLLWVVGSVLFAVALLREGARYYATSATTATQDEPDAATTAADAPVNIEGADVNAGAPVPALAREGRVV